MASDRGELIPSQARKTNLVSFIKLPYLNMYQPQVLNIEFIFIKE
jgi:hypothetical protein